ncbi:MAG: DUF814 domain-containing protein [Deltaproteobacteria bacterium]|nr:DUF814 domain-containing protein [Deltaproteobacteria bacterium]
MTLDAKTLSEVVRELRPLVGGRIQRIDLMDEREIVMEVRIPGRTVRLLVSAQPGVGRVHLVGQRGVRRTPAGALQGVLRQRLAGKTMTDLTTEGRSVIFAVTGMHLRIRIDGGKDAFRLLSTEFSRHDAAQHDAAQHDAAQHDAAQHDAAQRDAAQHDAALHEDVPYDVGRGEPGAELGGAALSFPISERIASFYASRVPSSTQEALRNEIAGHLRRRKKKLERLFDNLDRDRARLTEMSERAREAELLKPMLSMIKRGQAFVDALDYATGASVRIALDPSLSAKENMSRLFDRAKKGERGRPRVEARLEETRLEVDALGGALDALSGIDPSALVEFAERFASHTYKAPDAVQDPRALSGRKKVSGRGSPERQGVDRWARRFVAKDGSEIFVGRGAKENDRLTLAVARGDDLWLHARGTSGAHVVLRRRPAKSKPLADPKNSNMSSGFSVSSGSSAPGASRDHNDALLDAANLAVHYSGLKTDTKVEVTVAEARYVRKNKGDPPGRVQVARSRTLLISPDAKRIDRLFGRED